MTTGGVSIEIVPPALRMRWAEALAQAFALRHEVFVGERGWEFLRRPDELDIDAHDAGAATHVLARGRHRVLGHVRLIPGGYLAVAQADPARIRDAAGDAALSGLSRFCVTPLLATPLREAVIVDLFGAALRHLIAHGTGALLFDTDPSIVFMLRVLGFSIARVGEPVPVAGRSMVPIVLRLDASVLTGLPLKIQTWHRGAPGPARSAFRL